MVAFERNSCDSGGIVPWAYSSCTYRLLLGCNNGEEFLQYCSYKQEKNLKDSESVVVSPDCISAVRRYTHLGVMTAYGKSENAFVTESTLS